MKQMKQWTMTGLALALCFGLVACGGEEETPALPNAPLSTPVSEPVSEPVGNPVDEDEAGEIMAYFNEIEEILSQFTIEGQTASITAVSYMEDPLSEEAKALCVDHLLKVSDLLASIRDVEAPIIVMTAHSEFAVSCQKVADVYSDLADIYENSEDITGETAVDEIVIVENRLNSAVSDMQLSLGKLNEALQQ